MNVRLHVSENSQRSARARCAAFRRPDSMGVSLQARKHTELLEQHRSSSLDIPSEETRHQTHSTKIKWGVGIEVWVQYTATVRCGENENNTDVTEMPLALPLM